MKRLITILMMLGFLGGSTGAMLTPALADDDDRGRYYHKHKYKHHKHKHYRAYYRPYYVKPKRVYYYPAPYPYYVPARRLYVQQPVVYPAWYVPPPSLFNLNLRL